MTRKFRRIIRNFTRDTEGLVSVEFAIYAPIMLFVFASIVTFFDGFRQQNTNLKAAYTISDLISRETNYVNEDYIDSMHKLTALLVRSGTAISLRISVVRWDEADGRYYVDWSKVRGTDYAEWSDETIQNIKDSLPVMPDQERTIVVETRNYVTPVFNVGPDIMNIENLVFSRPRFAPQVVFVDTAPNDKSHSDNSNKVIQ